MCTGNGTAFADFADYLAASAPGVQGFGMHVGEHKSPFVFDDGARRPHEASLPMTRPLLSVAPFSRRAARRDALPGEGQAARRRQSNPPPRPVATTRPAPRGRPLEFSGEMSVANLRKFAEEHCSKLGGGESKQEL